ncbi:MAG TPA: hypothetical protein VK474_12740 [Chthoniobacterales bacterium]|nr:hypothetical protein [Chthoniobacterales bacterium]
MNFPDSAIASDTDARDGASAVPLGALSKFAIPHDMTAEVKKASRRTARRILA